MAERLSGAVHKAAAHMDRSRRGGVAEGKLGACQHMADRDAQRRPWAVAAGLSWVRGPCLAALDHQTHRLGQDYHHGAQIDNGRPKCICCLFLSRIGT